MKSQAQRAAKRRARESRESKGATWFCSYCKGRHPHGERCPNFRAEAPMPMMGGLELGVIAALRAAVDRGQR